MSKRSRPRRLRMVKNSSTDLIAESFDQRGIDMGGFGAGGARPLAITVDGELVDAAMIEGPLDRDASRVVLAVAAVGAVAFTRVAMHVARFVVDNA